MEQSAIQASLLANQDRKYRDLQLRLMPDVAPERVIGVRTPVLRAMAKELNEDFLSSLPHYYFEENQLHGFALERIRDFDSCLKHVQAFLPHVDNWATCDQFSPRAFARAPERLLEILPTWLTDPHPYTARFAMRMLMSLFLKERFKGEYLEWVANANREHYYVKMMVAWYFATALAFQYDATLPWILQRRLDPWTHRKAIQKALESFRVSPEHKEALRALR